MKPTFTLTTGTLDHIPDPTLPQIAEILCILPTSAPDDYLILERSDDASRGISISYLQTRPHHGYGYAGMFLVEFRDGVTGRQFKSYIDAGEPLLALFESYLQQDELWRDMVIWRDISFHFDDLRATLPAEELPSSFFDADEHQETLHDSERRNTEFWEKWSLMSE